MPITFTCPHCGAVTNVANPYIGKSGPCAQCGKTITVPDPWAGPSFNADRPSSGSGLSAGWIVFIVVACVGAAVLVCGGFFAMTTMSNHGVREAARRMQCTNNMKQIGLAIHNYSQAYKCLPPAYVADKNGKPLYSWRVLILPFLEGDQLHQQFHLDEPWNSPHNLALASQMPRTFCCPNAPGGGSTTSYAMIVGPHAVGNGAKPRKFDEIKDGTSNTILLVEAVGAGIPWTAPMDIHIDDAVSIRADTGVIPGTVNGMSSCHNGIVHVLFCDGSVQAIQADIDKKTLKALTTIDGGEKVGLNAD
jgi:prepilin-type processing-associated H-X9-DG protein